MDRTDDDYISWSSVLEQKKYSSQDLWKMMRENELDAFVQEVICEYYSNHVPKSPQEETLRAIQIVPGFFKIEASAIANNIVFNHRQSRRSPDRNLRLYIERDLCLLQLKRKLRDENLILCRNSEWLHISETDIWFLKEEINPSYVGITPEIFEQFEAMVPSNKLSYNWGLRGVEEKSSPQDWRKLNRSMTNLESIPRQNLKIRRKDFEINSAIFNYCLLVLCGLVAKEGKAGSLQGKSGKWKVPTVIRAWYFYGMEEFLKLTDFTVHIPTLKNTNIKKVGLDDTSIRRHLNDLNNKTAVHYLEITKIDIQ